MVHELIRTFAEFGLVRRLFNVRILEERSHPLFNGIQGMGLDVVETTVDQFHDFGGDVGVLVLESTDLISDGGGEGALV